MTVSQHDTASQLKLRRVRSRHIIRSSLCLSLQLESAQQEQQFLADEAADLRESFADLEVGFGSGCGLFWLASEVQGFFSRGLVAGTTEEHRKDKQPCINDCMVPLGCRRHRRRRQTSVQHRKLLAHCRRLSAR